MTRCRVSSNTWIYRSTRRRLAEQRSSGRGTCSPPPSLTQTSRFVPEIWMAERTLARSGSMISLRQLKTKIICSLTRFNRTVTGLEQLLEVLCQIGVHKVKVLVYLLRPITQDLLITTLLCIPIHHNDPSELLL